MKAFHYLSTLVRGNLKLPSDSVAGYATTKTSKTLRLSFTLSDVFSFPYALLRIGHPPAQPIYQWKAYEII